MSQKQTLGKILVNKGLVDSDSIDRALAVQSGGSRRLGYILVKMGFISDEELFNALSDQNNIPSVNIRDEITPGALERLPGYLCRRFGVIPVRIEPGNVLVLAMANPLDAAVIDEIDARTGMLVKPVLANQGQINDALDTHLPPKAWDTVRSYFGSRLFMAMVVMVLVLSAAVGILILRDLQVKKYGIASESGEIRVFSNHELLIGAEGDRVVSLIGHGPYAKGFYSVVFHDSKTLREFVNLKQDNFTSAQKQWVHWVLEKKLPDF